MSTPASALRMITSQSQTAGCKIWVDADACPKVIKEILYRAADRVPVMVTLVANQPLQVPRSPYIHTVQVPSGYDVADHHIVEKSTPGDLVVTADIPLAAELIGQGCIALNPRGELYNKENIRQRLNMRDFFDSLRSSGIHTGGPSSISQSDRTAFANQLDRLLRRSNRNR
mgnify:FL=1